MNSQYRFLARFIIEAKSPINIGSGKKGVKSDSLVLRDLNGLPYIPGTTLAGLLRHTLGDEEGKYMGSQEYGSPIIITEAKMLDSDSFVLDGIGAKERLNNNFLKHYRQLPIRQHAKIGHRGATIKGGKFDEEIVLKGTRFCFEIEMLSDKADDSKFKQLLNTFSSVTFRIGSGSRSGFGEIVVVNNRCLYKKIDFCDKNQRSWYLEKSSSLSVEWKDADILELEKPVSNGWTTYILNLTPIDFVLFGSGFGNEKADMTYVRESYVDWSGDVAQIKDQGRVILIPASSIKGALSHRLSFHYNKQRGNYADPETFLDENGKIIDEDEYKAYINSITGKNNPAVKAVFGSEGEKDEDGNMLNKQRGNVLMSDIIEEANFSSKILNHVSIDRFTGGAIDGALFSEETLFAKGLSFNLTLAVNNNAFVDRDVKNAFELSLKDLCSGMLPLGGGVNRGNGCFKGTIKRNKELIYENN